MEPDAIAHEVEEILERLAEDAETLPAKSSYDMALMYARHGRKYLQDCE